MQYSGLQSEAEAVLLSYSTWWSSSDTTVGTNYLVYVNKCGCCSGVGVGR